MISEETKQKVLPWTPMGFCVFLSVLTVCSNLWLSVANHNDTGGRAITFLCFLPMCFFFVGAALSPMQGEIRALRKQVQDLQSRQAS